MKHPQTNTTALTGPLYRGMTDDQCRIMHRASLDVLERTGVYVNFQPRRVGLTHCTQPDHPVQS
jgi:trimethylamine:corrinoid methyltransferase-like protein